MTYTSVESSNRSHTTSTQNYNETSKGVGTAMKDVLLIQGRTDLPLGNKQSYSLKKEDGLHILHYLREITRHLKHGQPNLIKIVSSVMVMEKWENCLHRYICFILYNKSETLCEGSNLLPMQV